ncbi:MAG: mycofactocin radical SAM maturase [Acidimicrobiales bacterium]
MSFDPSRAYHLDPLVALRPEGFGALAYHYGNRRLTLLRAPELVEVVEQLGDQPSARRALDAVGIGAGRHPAFEKALTSLERSGFIVEGARPSTDRAAPDAAGPSGGAHAAAPARAAATTAPPTRGTALTDQLKAGLVSPICLTWEWTYACNLQCVHCLSSSGRRDPDELTTDEMFAVVDDLHDLQVFYVNVGGGEPMLRPDFFDVTEYCVSRGVGVKFSTNGGLMTADKARRLAGMDYVDVQISLDGIDGATNDAVRGEGSWAKARRAMDHLAEADVGPFKISVVMTRDNVEQLDAFEALADRYGAELRLTRFRPSGRGAESWHDLHPTQEQQRRLYHWLLERPHVLTGDSFFHLSALGEPLPGLNLCGAGRVVCLIDPVGDVYACPFVLHDEFRAGSVRDPGGFGTVWRSSTRFAELREPQSAGACASCGSYDACQGGCMATKFFTGLPLDGPDPECVKGHGEAALAGTAVAAVPVGGDGTDHSWSPVRLGRKPISI